VPGICHTGNARRVYNRKPTGKGELKNPRVYITGMGIISPLGAGCPATLDALIQGQRQIIPLSLFPVLHGDPLPVGQIQVPMNDTGPPRTHQLALKSAREALSGHNRPPEAIIIGSTTGGMPDTENRLMDKIEDPEAYRYHATGSVADYLADTLGCSGPVLTVSTACSSGTATFKIALELLRTGRVKSVLAGGIDALCRLTYYGFNALQLIDPSGPKPFDRHRHGMGVGEAAALLLLEASETPPENAVAELQGAGLSCDAYHPTAPHPQGDGALAAMIAALADADTPTDQIDYINLHGTGTIDNDASEAAAIDRLFPHKKPVASSIKGSTGHSLAAAGAVGAIVSALAIHHGLIPANTGMNEPDPKLPLRPTPAPVRKPVNQALVNSLGFGGNNAAAVLGQIGSGKSFKIQQHPKKLSVLANACLTGAGDTTPTLDLFCRGQSLAGQLSASAISTGLPTAMLRRLKRLPRMVLSLCAAIDQKVDSAHCPGSVYLGTGWGALSETHRFLTQLFESDERFASPIDFTGSVHNAPAGHVATYLKARGPNLTLTGGDYSFEQALFTASLLAEDNDQPCIVIGADEHHPDFTPLFDSSSRRSQVPSDGGAAFCLQHGSHPLHPTLCCLFYAHVNKNPEVISEGVATLNKAVSGTKGIGAILYGRPKRYESIGKLQLDSLTTALSFKGPQIPYRSFTGEFATASAVATSLALALVRDQKIPTTLTGARPFDLNGQGILILGLGKYISAILVNA